MQMPDFFPNEAPGPVLSSFPLFRTSDLDEARERVSRVFCDHRLVVVGRDQHLGTELYCRSIRGVSLGRMRYGADVAIDPGRLESFVLVQMLVRGSEQVAHCGQLVDSTPEVASVVSPMRSMSMRHGAETEKLFVRIDREALERHCRQHLGGDMTKPLEFEPRMPLLDARCASWLRLMRWLYDEAGHERFADAASLDSSLVAAQLEQVVIATLLLTQPHNYSERLASDGPSLAPRFVKRAEGFIDEHAHEPLTIGQIAEYVGVSSRTLFAGFRRFRDTTPLHHLKNVRLQRVRDELLAASSNSTTVTSIALRWGFSHLGHFTVDYRQRFGESPSATLHR